METSPTIVPRMTKRDRLVKLITEMPDTDIRDAMEHLSRMDPLIWCMYFRNLRGQPLTYDARRYLTPAAIDEVRRLTPKRVDFEIGRRLKRHRPFLIDPMRDQHPHKVYKKARQMGVSELSISEVVQFLWATPSHGQARKWVYTFPRDTQLAQFSTSRIAEMWNESPRMRSIPGVPNQMYIKRIGAGFMMLRSAWESGLGEGIDADGVTLDEKDRMKKGVDIAFKECLKSSDYGLLREVSTPTLLGEGVDAPYRESDQRCWLVKCERCGLEQEVLYPDNIIQTAEIRGVDLDAKVTYTGEPIPLGTTELPVDSYAFACKMTKCRGPLDRMVGRYVAKRPDRKNIRGYHIPQTIAPWITATDLMQDKINYKFVDLWTRYCLGNTAEGTSQLTTEESFMQSCAGYQPIKRRGSKWRHITVGIDWGQISWAFVLGENSENGRLYLLNIFIVEDSVDEPLSSAIELYNMIEEAYTPELWVADGGYGKDRNAYLLKKLGPGRFYACWYNAASKGNRSFTPVWSNPEAARVTVDRTVSLKVFCKAIRMVEIGLPVLEDQKVALFKQHVRNLVPMMEQDEEDGTIVETVGSQGADHLAHAGTYAYLGMDAISQGGAFNFDFLPA